MQRSMHAGICETCRHQRVVVSGRGSTFSLCRLGDVVPGMVRYPRLPVVDCAQWEQRAAGGAQTVDADQPPG